MAGPGPVPGDPDEQYDFLFKLVLVGDASVGKTCVVQRFKTGAFSERQGSTIGVDFTMKTLEIQGKRVKRSPRPPRAPRVSCGDQTLPPTPPRWQLPARPTRGALSGKTAPPKD
ncbi:Ras- protein Rab-43 [Saguinus oedipus]|uniref:Ras- protein Rab-43 n=1 Tax=Saguinus oedipus TaxID=9490 RepID=A0ABQ9U3L2_SAGOE|nr:Ras- protein Rab-43 [Saguinus oedipus]